jgi:hypothetical protein
MIRFGVGALLDFQYLTDAADWSQIPSTATGDGEAYGELRGRMDNDADQIPGLPGTNAINMLFSSAVGAPAIEPHGITAWHQEWAIILPGLRVPTCAAASFPPA